MGLLGISALLLVFLFALLAGGVWIAIALLATGYVGMQFVAGGIPAGPVLATTVWGNSASWTLAALPLFIWMGEILYSDEAFGGDVSAVSAPWLNRVPGSAPARQRTCLWNLRIGFRLVGRDVCYGREDRAAGIEKARLRRDDLRSVR